MPRNFTPFRAQSAKTLSYRHAARVILAHLRPIFDVIYGPLLPLPTDQSCFRRDVNLPLPQWSHFGSASTNQLAGLRNGGDDVGLRQTS